MGKQLKEETSRKNIKIQKRKYLESKKPAGNGLFTYFYKLSLHLKLSFQK
jgi:hypothetical protein